MVMQSVGKMSLKNGGGFVAKIQYVYIDDDGNKKTTDTTGDIPLGQTKTADPGDMGVPDGALVYMKAFVVWGNDNESTKAFKYQKSNSLAAHYVITGTTLDNDLGLVGVDG